MTENSFFLPTPKILSKIEKKYKILDKIDFLEFDHNFDILKERLLNIKRSKFLPDERILITHTDTDYYNDKILNFGLYIYNTLCLIKDCDIPMFVVLIYTSNIGIKKEINEILNTLDHPSDDRPEVLESFLVNTHYNQNAVKNVNINTHKIKYAAVSMMGAPRSHRFSLYNYLKNNQLLDRVELSIRGYKQ